MGVVNVLLAVFFLGVLPLCIGLGVCPWLGLRKGFAGTYLAGSFTEWALFQIITVPMALFKRSLDTETLAMSLALGAMCALGVWALIRGEWQNLLPRRQTDGAGVFALVLLAAGLILLSVEMARHMTLSRDDCRNVAEVVDMLRTNRMYRNDPSTGAALAQFDSDWGRDLFAPWAVYTAYLARMTGIQGTIMAHSVLPEAILVCMACAYWEIGERSFPGNTFAKAGGTLLALGLVVFGSHAAVFENVALWRIWQGKAVIAAVGIPGLYLALAPIPDRPEGWKPYMPLYLVCLACCLMSNQGILTGGLVCGAFGLVWGIRTRKIGIAMKVWAGALICAFYYGAYRVAWSVLF